MNIFYVDECPSAAAHALCDKHVIKMAVESAQILSTALRSWGHDDPQLFKSTHIHHPCVRWASETADQFEWLMEHCLALVTEYWLRYGYGKMVRVNAMFEAANRAWPKILEVKPKGWTDPPQCMPEIYRKGDVVEAYRAYYIGEKARFARWERGTAPPHWWPDGKKIAKRYDFDKREVTI